MIYKAVEEERSWKSDLGWFAIYLLMVAIVMVAALFCMRALLGDYFYCEVSGRSMQPTINPDVTKQSDSQDGVLVKVTKNVDYDDIIIIDDGYEIKIENGKETKTPRTIIKRVIAKSNDALTIVYDETDQKYHTYRIRAEVIRDGGNQAEMLDESYISDEDMVSWIAGGDEGARLPRADTTSYKTTIKYEGLFYTNYLYHFSHSSSAIDRAKVRLGQITKMDGQECNAIFYQLGEGELFYMGDHRSASSDARLRSDRFHTISYDKIKGKVVWKINNAVSLSKRGLLWWAKIEALFGYFWNQTANFFA